MMMILAWRAAAGTAAVAAATAVLAAAAAAVAAAALSPSVAVTNSNFGKRHRVVTP